MCVCLVPALTGRLVKLGFPFWCDVLLLSKKKCKLQGSWGGVSVWLFFLEPRYGSSSVLVTSQSRCQNMNPSQWKEVADLKVWFYDLVIVGSKDGHSLVFMTRWSIRKQRNAKIFRNCRKVEHVVSWSPFLSCNYLLCNSSPVFS
jgi:hypothetical protein